VVATVVSGVTLGFGKPALDRGPGPVSHRAAAAVSGAARGTGKIRLAARTRKNLGPRV
jgi:hypothetical protein